MKPIPYGKQNITEDDIKSVERVLRSDYLTQGPEILKFQTAFADYVNSKFSIAVANGTAALHLCTLALGLKPNQKVITTPITFVASANCIRYCGGEVIFADIVPDTYLLDINSVRRLLESSPIGSYAGIIAVDFAGRAINLEEFRVLADEFNLWIIEDACHAPGGYFINSDNKIIKCGSGKYADLSIFSFHPVKHITCGEGGMITTNNEKLKKKIEILRTHGITKDSKKFTNPKNLVQVQGEQNFYPEWYMEMQDLGFNYRLSEIQSVLGLSQLNRAREGVKRRRKIAKKYFKAFKDKKFIINQSGIIKGHAYHLYVIEIEERLELYKFLRERNIFCQIHYFPTHLMPYYQEFGWKIGDFPNSENFYNRCLSLPMYPTLEDNDLNYIIDSVLNFYNTY
jgi:UDP-4-amino-4,6-dideoxy-N-acetyl-beta-L-altrosamine transaminase